MSLPESSSKFLNSPEVNKPISTPTIKPKKSKGKQPIEIKYIPDKNKRNSTGSKRINGMKKKVRELETLCGAQVLLYIETQTGRKHNYATENLKPIIDLIEEKLRDCPQVGSQHHTNITDEDSNVKCKPFSTVNPINDPRESDVFSSAGDTDRTNPPILDNENSHCDDKWMPQIFPQLSPQLGNESLQEMNRHSYRSDQSAYSQHSDLFDVMEVIQPEMDDTERDLNPFSPNTQEILEEMNIL